MAPSASRRVWLLQIGEPLPQLTKHQRLLRTALLADALVERGHRVTWWASTFDHSSKRFLANAGRHAVRDGYDLELLAGIGYPGNLSLRRLVNQVQVARRFRHLAASAERPDVVVCSLPSVELAAEGVSFARRHGVPVLVDVRDLWPDAIVGLAPGPARPFLRLALGPMYRAARRALAGADAIMAVSEAYLRWGLEVAGRPRRERDLVAPLAYPKLTLSPDELADAERRLRAAGVDPRRRIALFVGTFGRTADLSTVIAAARRMRERGRDDVQFVLAGAGDHEATLRAEAAGLSNVVFTGWLSGTEIAWALSVAWVGLAAYARAAPQGLPNKPFEYMSGSLPILSSLGGEARSLLERHGCGLTYRAGESADLVAALESLLADPARRDAMARASAAAFTANYSADVVIPEMADYVVGAAGSASGRERGAG